MDDNAVALKDEVQLTDLAAQVGDRLRRQGWRVTTAESCTGGGIAYLLTSVAGSSDWFEEGFVTYANRAKRERLGVPPSLLAGEGAVSQATVEAMAEGASRQAQAQCAIAVSGIAGPGGAVPGKPVGTVWFAWCVGGHVQSECFTFPGDRRSVRLQAMAQGLKGLLSRLPNLI